MSTIARSLGPRVEREGDEPVGGAWVHKRWWVISGAWRSSGGWAGINPPLTAAGTRG
ncbi:MAG: hypothetical protein JWN11_1263 [Hyphomicrobiales bacterium]|nr:hypothetical protein [Hyphomicrobiales bacterium]